MDSDVKAYIDSVNDERHDLYLKMHEVILEMYPDIAIKISYSIPQYSFSKDEWVFVSYNKLGITLHVGYKGNVPEFSKQYPKFKTGKACVHFKPKDVIPWEDIKKLIKQAIRK